MSSAARQDPRLYGKAGVADGLNPKAPLVITEKPHQHRCASETECYDCGNLIAKGEPMVVSALDITQGMKGKAPRYNIHLACYDVVGRVVIALGKDATHSFEGRPKLGDLWRLHHVELRRRDKALADMLEGVFGKP